MKVLICWLSGEGICRVGCVVGLVLGEMVRMVVKFLFFYGGVGKVVGIVRFTVVF